MPRRLQGIIRVLGRLRADITKTEAMAERKAGESFPYLASGHLRGAGAQGRGRLPALLDVVSITI